jgi:arylsulfatase A-like enzyme
VFTSDNGGLIGNKKNRVTNNFPLRDGKGQAYEGGVRVPFFMVGPGIEKNETSEIPVTSADILPTLNALASLNVDEKVAQQWSGTDVSAILKGSNNMPERPLVWHYPHYHSEGATPYSAIRLGDYKLIHFYEDDSYELYNLKEDIGEQNNLVLSHQNQVKTLKAELERLLTSYNAQYPTPNPNFDSERPRRKN